MAIDPLKKPDKVDSNKNKQELSNKDAAKLSFDKNNQHSYEKILAIKQIDSNRDLNKDDENGGSNLGSNNKAEWNSQGRPETARAI